MNYDALYEQRWLDGAVGIEVFVLYEDQLVTVYYSRESQERFSEDSILNQVMPDWRCYRYGGKITVKGVPDLVRPKYTDAGMQYMFDATMFIKPKHSTESYEFGWNGFEAAHDDFNNAHTDESVNIYQWRQHRPELGYLFDTLKSKPECKQFMRKILVLGAHVPIDQMNTAYEQMIKHWRSRMEKMFENRVWRDNVGLRIHHDICLAVELPRTSTSGRWNLMMNIISDDLQSKLPQLLDAIENNLNIDIQELRTARHHAIRNAVNTWFESTVVNKVLSKCESLHGQESMSMYKTLYRHHVTQVMLHALEHSISETIKQYEEQ
jgi:hypothetical protein